MAQSDKNRGKQFNSSGFSWKRQGDTTGHYQQIMHGKIRNELPVSIYCVSQNGQGIENEDER